MKINVRIDDRMIHGQVAAIWCNQLKTTRIVVVNDEVANDELKKIALKMTVPIGIKCSIITKDKAIANIKADKYKSDNILLILTNPKDALYLAKQVALIKSINVGNMGHKENTTKVKRNIYLTKEDIEDFKKLSAMGIKLTAIMVPDENQNNLLDFISDRGI